MKKIITLTALSLIVSSCNPTADIEGVVSGTGEQIKGTIENYRDRSGNVDFEVIKPKDKNSEEQNADEDSYEGYVEGEGAQINDDVKPNNPKCRSRFTRTSVRKSAKGQFRCTDGRTGEYTFQNTRVGADGHGYGTIDGIRFSFEMDN